jgi:hypothetical protein
MGRQTLFDELAATALQEKWSWRCPGGRAGILGCDDVSNLMYRNDINWWRRR